MGSDIAATTDAERTFMLLARIVSGVVYAYLLGNIPGCWGFCSFGYLDVCLCDEVFSPAVMFQTTIGDSCSEGRKHTAQLVLIMLYYGIEISAVKDVGVELFVRFMNSRTTRCSESWMILKVYYDSLFLFTHFASS